MHIYKTLPETPGVYIMKDSFGRILYVGKAGNLRRRVASYFERPHDARIAALVEKIKNIEYRKTDTALEALILESMLIKKYSPPFNVREKDDKSFLYIEITKEKFPRVLLVRGKDNARGARFGPFVSASSARAALNILRRIFPWSTHDPVKVIDPGAPTVRASKTAHGTPPVTQAKSAKPAGRPCLDYEIGLCPGTCIGAISRRDYVKNIAWLELFFKGKKKKIIASLKKEMTAASRQLEFEKAEKLRRQLFALQHIMDTALIGDGESKIRNLEYRKNPESNEPKYRIEGYDISNIAGDAAVGSMVVFENGAPNTDEYRKFKIRTIFQPDDAGMLTEVLARRFKNNWPLPDLVLIDGGLPQVNAARRALVHAGARIPVVGIAKGPERKRNDIIGAVPKGVSESVLVRIRDEAHRFAIGYHKALRRRNFLDNRNK